MGGSRQSDLNGSDLDERGRKRGEESRREEERGREQEREIRAPPSSSAISLRRSVLKQTHNPQLHAKESNENDKYSRALKEKGSIRQKRKETKTSKRKESHALQAYRSVDSVDSYPLY
jgi:hypothetical protein